jgi:signal transduction histidine kinase/ActR/RegA family two-component response regulator
MRNEPAKSGRSPERGPLGHIVLTLLALMVVWGGIATNLTREYNAARTDAIKDTGNLAHAFAENIARTIEAVDQTLLVVRDYYQRDGVAFDLPAWGRTHQLLKSLPLQVTIVNKAGNLVTSNLGPTPSSVNFADRPHFKVQAASTTDQLVISTPVEGRILRSSMIVFVRKLVAPDGSFNGTVNVLLDPLDLSRFYGTVSIGQGAITLMKIDGSVLARAPAGEDMVGKVLPSPFLPTMQTGSATGNFTTISALDGTPRLFSYRRLDEYGLLLSVGYSEADIFAQYWASRRVTLIAGVLLTIGIIGAARVMIRQRQRILRSRAVLGAAMENMAQGIQMVDPDGRIAVINSRAVEMLGIPGELLEGDPHFKRIVEWQTANGEFGPPEAWPRELIETLEAGGITRQDDVYERTRPNGMVMEVRTTPMPGGGAVRTFTDITERKRNEAVLAAAQKAAEASIRARTEFLTMMSHEIRTPMNSVIGCTSLLMDMPLSQAALQYVRIIRQSGQHLLQLINDILDLSKLDAGRLQLEAVAFDPRELVTGSIEVMTPQAAEKRLRLDFHIDSAVPHRVVGDPARLRQILINLIGNAIKFTSVGGVTIHVTVPPAGGLAFAVSDTGIGIPAEKIPLLFNYFAQADSSVSRQFGGTGLGLAICKRLVGQMGGEISVTSEAGRGSTFQFVLPPRVGDAVQTGGATDGTHESYRVLLADDNASNRMVLARMLERQNHRVDNVANGLEAVEAVRDRTYDLVIMDIVMPEMDGLAAAAAIRALPGSAGHIPIIGLTANTGAGVKESCLRAGMNGFMTKPVLPDRLRREIESVMATMTELSEPG